MTGPDRGQFCQGLSVIGTDRTGLFLRPVSHFFKKNGTIVPIFFPPSVCKRVNGEGKDMTKTETCSEESEEVFQVALKHVVIGRKDPGFENQGLFYQSLCVMFKIRVDVWRRSNNLSEDRAKLAGLGVSRCDRLFYTLRICQYT